MISKIYRPTTIHLFLSTGRYIHRRFEWSIAAIYSWRAHNHFRIRYHLSTNYKKIRVMVTQLPLTFRLIQHIHENIPFRVNKSKFSG